MLEGKIQEGMKVLMIDDVATTGGSVVNAIKSLKASKITVEDAFVIVNRMEGAEKALLEQGITMHSLTNVITITKTLNEQNLVNDEVFAKLQRQMDK